MKQHTLLALASIFLVVLMPYVAAFEADFDLRRVNYPDPVIGVTFNEPVSIVAAGTFLVQLDTGATRQLTIAGTPGTGSDPYFRDFELSTSSLADAPYGISIQGSSTLGLVNDPPATIAFEVSGMQIRLHDPEFGFSPRTPYRVTLETYVIDQTDGVNETIPFNAECRYYLGSVSNAPSYGSLLPLTPSERSTDPDQYNGGQTGTLHTTPGTLYTPKSKMTVMCRQFKLNGQETDLVVQEFEIGSLDRGSVINVTVTPQRVTNLNKPYAELAIMTEHETTCTIAAGPYGGTGEQFELGTGSDFSTTHGHIIRYDNDEGVNSDYSNDLSEHIHTYTVTCKNKAGHESHKTIDITINFGEILQITIVEPGLGLTNGDENNAKITTNLPATCTMNGAAMTKTTETGMTHERGLSLPSFGNYTLAFYCSGDEKEATKNITILVDQVPPSPPDINANGTICDGQAHMYVTAEDNHGVSRILYQLQDSTGKILAQGVTQGDVSIVVPLTSEEFTWTAWAEDLAGNVGSSSTAKFVSRPGNSDECDDRQFINYYKPPNGWEYYPFRAQIETKRPAACGYLLVYEGLPSGTFYLPAASADGIIHSLIQMPTVTGDVQDVKVRCTEGDDEHTRTMTFGIYRDLLVIKDLVADPNPVRNYQERLVTVTATTNHDAACTISRQDVVPFDGEDAALMDTYKKQHEHTLDFSFIDRLLRQTYYYTVSCTDLAGKKTQQALPIVVDFLSPFDIEVFSPARYVNNPDVTVTVRPSQPAICFTRNIDSYGSSQLSPMTAQGDKYTTTFLDVNEGAHSVFVRCQNQVGVTSDKVIAFSLDSVAPNVFFAGLQNICPQGQTALSLIPNELINNTQVSVQSSSNSYTKKIDRVMVIYGKNHTPGDYLDITATGQDYAGNQFTAKYNVTIKGEFDPTCNYYSPTCGDGIIQSNEQCDGANLGTQTDCSLHGNYDGTILFCTHCQYDMRTCYDRYEDPIRDCTDPNAVNYNPRATVNDGSCRYEYPVPGCTDSEAWNYNPLATQDDGSCQYTTNQVPGCTDPQALNFNPRAGIDDGSCDYPGDTGDPIRDCTDRNALNYNPRATINDGSCRYPDPNNPNEPIRDCTDPYALNYNPRATQDDGSCDYPDPDVYIRDCMDPTAINYNPRANINDGSCIYSPDMNVWDCTNPNAVNYNPRATRDDGSCVYPDPNNPNQPIYDCTDSSAHNYNPQATVDDGSCIYSPASVIRDCTDPQATNYNPRANYDDGSCQYPDDLVYDCTDPNANNYNPRANVNDGSCTYTPSSTIRDCTDPQATNYNPRATQDDGTCDYPIDEIRDCTNRNAVNYNPRATQDDGSCFFPDPNNPNQPVPDCTDPAALNYNPFATVDDGTCQYDNGVRDCTDPNAVNYNPAATIDDGTCFYPDPNNPNQPVPDCTDPGALNYNSRATVDDGSCVYEEPGWDVYGCPDPLAFNYNPRANINDGSCQYREEEVPDCTDPNANNYNPRATVDDRSCTYADPDNPNTNIYDCTNAFATNYNPRATVDDGSCIFPDDQIPDCTDRFAVNYNPRANVDDGSCEYASTDNPNPPVEDCTDGRAINYNPLATVDDGSCFYQPVLSIFGCMDSEAFNYNPRATQDDGSCTYVPPVLDCTDPAALNYNPLATIDDDTCRYPLVVRDCMDRNANNFNPRATVDDGSCEYGRVVADCTNSTAYNYNPRATIDDGSCLFAAPGQEPEDILDCTDRLATNYNPLATQNDGSCTYAPLRDCTNETAINYNPLATEDDGTCEYLEEGDEPLTLEPGTNLEDEDPPYDDGTDEPNTPTYEPPSYERPTSTETGGLVEKGFPWLALVLVLLGVLLMGGASYYLYVADQDRHARQQAPPPQYVPPIQRESAVERLKKHQQRQEAFKQKAEAHKTERKKLTGAFGDAPEDETAEEKEPITETVDLEEVNMKLAGKKKESDKSEKDEKSDKSGFERLEEFVDKVRGKKGQIQHVFGFLIVAIVLIATIVLAINLMGIVSERSCVAELSKLERTLNDIERTYDTYGTRQESDILAACGADYLCVIGPNTDAPAIAALGVSDGMKSQLDIANTLSGDRPNIFVFSEDAIIDEYALPKFHPENNAACVKNVGGRFSIRTEGYGNRLTVEPR